MLGSFLLGLTLSDSHKLFIEDTIADESFLGMKIFLEGLPDNTVGVDEYSELLKHSIDIGVHFAFTAFVHNDET